MLSNNCVLYLEEHNGVNMAVRAEKNMEVQMYFKLFAFERDVRNAKQETRKQRKQWRIFTAKEWWMRERELGLTIKNKQRWKIYELITENMQNFCVSEPSVGICICIVRLESGRLP